MPESDLSIINWLLTTKQDSDPGAFKSVVHWKKQHAPELLTWAEPVDMAIAGGFLAGCPAYAFASGYWAALYRLLPGLPKTPVPALCISEEGGPHPARIKCRLEKKGPQWQLNGTKHFVTCGREADLLLVAASTGLGPDGKNRLRLVQVQGRAVGLSVKPLGKPLTILPEISHGMVEFRDVQVPADSVLDGDGYQVYVKPFRTIEDLHVLAAVCGHLLRIGALAGWPQSAREKLLALLLSIRPLARADYTAPETHIAAAGAMTLVQSVLEGFEPLWDQVAAPWRSAWQRDRVVLDIAAEARTKRRTAAWRRFA